MQFESKALRQFLYENLGFLWPVRRGKARWVNLLARVLDVGPYGSFKVVPLGNYKLRLDPGDAHDRFLFFSVVGDGYTHLLRRLLRSGDTVIDGGANIGHFTAVCAELVGSTGAVYAIEANPVLHGRLQLLAADVSKTPIHPLHCALWREEGQLQFKIATVSGWSSLIENETFQTAQKIDVRSRTIDEILQSEAVPGRVRLLKLDLEGAEYDALLGAKELLGRQEVDFILLEAEPKRLRAFGRSGLEIADLMTQHRYRAACLIDSEAILPVTDERRLPGTFNGDYLYVREDLFEETRSRIFGPKTRRRHESREDSRHAP